MRLAEIKHSLIDQFFSANANGISVNETVEVFEKLGKLLESDIESLADRDTQDVQAVDGVSNDPTKAFKRFTEGRRAILRINEDVGVTTNTMFAAARIGKKVYFTDLTAAQRVEKKGDLASIKQALRQAKNLNDDAYFSIVNEG